MLGENIERTAFACADWWADRLEREDKRDEFRAALQRRIIGGCHPEHGISLRVDYDPDAVLLAALREVGIECRGFMWSADGLLPLKTTMLIRNDRVEVKEGYAAPWACLLGTPRTVEP